MIRAKSVKRTAGLVCLVAWSAFAEERGLDAKSALEAVTQVDSRLPEWLKGKGDRKKLLATRAEVEAWFAPLTQSKAEQKKFVDEAMAAMKLGKLPKKFVPTRALSGPVEGEGSIEMFFLEAEGKMVCGVNLHPLPDKRLVIEAGPICREAPVEKVLKSPKKAYFEKKDGAWVEVERPAP